MTSTIQRNWSLYNLAQTKEKQLSLRIISDAIDYLQLPYIYKGDGRPSMCLDDMLKCCIIKVFNNFSSRRSMVDIQWALDRGYIRMMPHFNTINNYMQKEEIEYYLKLLYKALAMPFTGIETNFAVDGTGFSTLRKRNWLESRLGNDRRDFRKLGVTIGVLSKVITSAVVTDGYSHDIVHFEGMIRNTAKNFKMGEIYADAGYLSRLSCEVAESVGAVPYIMVKENTRFHILSKNKDGWNRMIWAWKINREEFLRHYNMRSVVESVFSAMKRKNLHYIRSKADQAQTNEILCKVVCHNASVLCHAMFEIGLDLNFEGIE